jgi:hypothetical protein
MSRCLSRLLEGRAVAVIDGLLPEGEHVGRVPGALRPDDRPGPCRQRDSNRLAGLRSSRGDHELSSAQVHLRPRQPPSPTTSYRPTGRRGRDAFSSTTTPTQ